MNLLYIRVTNNTNDGKCVAPREIEKGNHNISTWSSKLIVGCPCNASVRPSKLGHLVGRTNFVRCPCRASDRDLSADFGSFRQANKDTPIGVATPPPSSDTTTSLTMRDDDDEIEKTSASKFEAHGTAIRYRYERDCFVMLKKMRR